MKPDIGSILANKGHKNEGRPEAPFDDIGNAALALRELEAATRTGAAVLLALDDAAVAGQEAVGLHRTAQARLELRERLGDAVTDGARLARQAAAGHGGDHVEL